jgi:hypothetical protein
VQETPAAPPRRRGALVAVIVVMLVVLAAAAAVIARYRSTPAQVTQTTATTTVAPPSTTSVSVTAPDTGTVVEQQDTAAPSADTASSRRAGSAEITTEPTPTKDASTDTAPATPSPVPESTSSESSVDALYANAMSQLAGGDAIQARKTLHRVLMQDPHYARAHLRMGEIALFNRNLNYASEELNHALSDSDRLDRREQQLARLSLAITSHDREEIGRLSAQIDQRWPDDPDLARMRSTFPGMFNEFPREQRGRRRIRD